jgi:allantoinase
VKAGVCGFKGFLMDSGVPEFPHVRASDIDEAMRILEGTGTILMFHAELSDTEDSNPTGPTDGSYQEFLDSRPDRFEVAAISQVVKLAKKYPDLRIHIVHLASAEALPILRQAKADGIKITAETCFHYLTFQADEIPHNATQYKCCPPIRTADNREHLWKAIKEGLITSVVSDHSPCTPDLKQGDFMHAWGGVSCLGLGLQVLWTAASKHGLSIGDVSRLTSLATAQQVRMAPQKGVLTVGSDADLCIWDPEQEWTVGEGDLHFKNKVSPYLGRKLRGRVLETWLKAKQVWTHDGKWTEPQGSTIIQAGANGMH